ncbi:hypothetical protein [Mesorhizobium sp. ES1-4]|uniref:hypothetical protein n=1 Tax=Mesorhizobium sp. ES1-4 TaxID=2876627 RepID=UPI001CC94F03|nr:hypothetical protein [Mesorhizobium sp. ES1-4]MBZ9796269.1 hypothetical protein [Mesorhizobium sp. ES1-4]
MPVAELIRGPGAALDYFLAFLSRSERCPPVSKAARFGRTTVMTMFHGFTAEAAYAEALRPADASGSAAFTIHVIDGAACGLQRPRLSWTAADFGEKRVVPAWSDADTTTYFLRGEDGFAVADWTTRRAFIWLPSSRAVPWYERAAPFRWLFDGLAARLGMSTLHAAAVGFEGHGVLIAGRGGVGKSTMALACLGDGLDYVGDDYCLFDHHQEPRVHALYSTAKWRRGAAVVPAWLNAVPADAADMAEHKNILFVDRLRQDQLVKELSIAAIVIPAVAGLPEPVLQPIPPQVALANLAASTIAQSEHDGAKVMRAIARLARAVPAYRLQMSRDADASAAAIRSLLTQPGSKSGDAP